MEHATAENLQVPSANDLCMSHRAAARPWRMADLRKDMDALLAELGSEEAHRVYHHLAQMISGQAAPGADDSPAQPEASAMPTGGPDNAD